MKFKKIAKNIGFISILAYGLTMIYVFMNAYFNGFQTLVTVNDYKEAHLEFWLILITFPFIVYSFLIELKNQIQPKVETR